MERGALCHRPLTAVADHAGRLGLSRGEYLRRRPAQDAATHSASPSERDLARFAERFGSIVTGGGEGLPKGAGQSDCAPISCGLQAACPLAPRLRISTVLSRQV
jgi:hypothetical protein